MQYDHDVVVIGLGPAGMAVAGMASEMGLNVCAIEKNKIGGECMNVGCIPSKALLRMARTRAAVCRFEDMELSETPSPGVLAPFRKIRSHLDYISEKKTLKMFDKAELILGEGPASFVDDHRVQVGERVISGSKIFVCAGTRPAVPPIPGIESVEVLTNETIFNLDEIPESLTILGGGAIGCELAQAFQRLGARVTIVHMDPHLVPVGEERAGHLLERELTREGVTILNGRKAARVEPDGKGIALITDRDERIVSERLLVGAGRKVDLSELALDRAGVFHDRQGITVNDVLQTTVPHIYAPGDVNGTVQLSHAAMHQGMIAIMNSMLPRPFKRRFRRYTVPWTVFTDPQISHVGRTDKQLQEEGITYEAVEAAYGDYGAAIAEGVATGYVRVYVGRTGRILGAAVVGEGSGEMINEWALAIQKRLCITDIMMLQHSFPTMSFLNKRVAEIWMTDRMQSPWLRRLVGRLYRRDG